MISQVKPNTFWTWIYLFLDVNFIIRIGYKSFAFCFSNIPATVSKVLQTACLISLLSLAISFILVIISSHGFWFCMESAVNCCVNTGGLFEVHKWELIFRGVFKLSGSGLVDDSRPGRYCCAPVDYEPYWDKFYLSGQIFYTHSKFQNVVLCIGMSVDIDN